MKKLKMEGENLLARLDELIVREEGRRKEIEDTLDILRQVRQALQQVPATSSAGDEDGKSGFMKVVEFLRLRGNQPQSARAIMEETGIPRGTLAKILYRSHAGHFVSTVPEGYSRKKLWALREPLPASGREEAAESTPRVVETLFGAVGDMVGVSAGACCIRILREGGNKPLNVLTMAREALRRGYSGGARGTPDDVLMTTAKSFWAKLSRDDRFVAEGPAVFRLSAAVAAGPPNPPPAKDDDQPMETGKKGKEGG
ncbi:MAG TPA: hypothetical protein VJ739_03390 [Gemmataceae bacterium]|nr:hypothetical protein [Gemmataceae bacterium]